MDFCRGEDVLTIAKSRNASALKLPGPKTSYQQSVSHPIDQLVNKKRYVRLRHANVCTNKMSSTLNKCVPPLQSAKVLTLRHLPMDMLIFSHKLAVPATTTETLQNCSSKTYAAEILQKWLLPSPDNITPCVLG